MLLECGGGRVWPPVRLTAVLLVVVLLQGALGDPPSPLIDPTTCRSQVAGPSSVCDPDGLLTMSQAQTIEALCAEVRARAICACPGSCDPYSLTVLLLPATNGTGSAHERARQYAEKTRKSWNNGGTCGADVVIFYSAQDNLLVASVGDHAGKRVLEYCQNEIQKETDKLLTSNNFSTALVYMVTEYKTYLNENTCKAPSEVLGTNKTLLIAGVFIGIVVVVVGLYFFIRCFNASCLGRGAVPAVPEKGPGMMYPSLPQSENSSPYAADVKPTAPPAQPAGRPQEAPPTAFPPGYPAPPQGGHPPGYPAPPQGGHPPGYPAPPPGAYPPGYPAPPPGSYPGGYPAPPQLGYPPQQQVSDPWAPSAPKWSKQFRPCNEGPRVDNSVNVRPAAGPPRQRQTVSFVTVVSKSGCRNRCK